MLTELLDPENVAKADQDQAALRLKNAHRVPNSPARVNYVFGCSIEQNVLNSIQSDDFSHAGADRLARLGEAYALQGRFEDAAAITPNLAYKAAYEARARAMQSVGARLCLCPAYLVRVSPTDAKGTREPTQHKIEEVFDGDRVISFYRCGGCQKISAE